MVQSGCPQYVCNDCECRNKLHYFCNSVPPKNVQRKEHIFLHILSDHPQTQQFFQCLFHTGDFLSFKSVKATTHSKQYEQAFGCRQSFTLRYPQKLDTASNVAIPFAEAFFDPKALSQVLILTYFFFLETSHTLH